MSADTPAPGEVGRTAQPVKADRTPELSALEQALRRALDSVPRDQVVKCIVSVLPATVFVDESARLHGGKVRKVSAYMWEALADAVRTRTCSCGFSRYVPAAVDRPVRRDLVGELLAQFA